MSGNARLFRSNALQLCGSRPKTCVQKRPVCEVGKEQVVVLGDGLWPPQVADFGGCSLDTSALSNVTLDDGPYVMASIEENTL